MTKKEMGKRKQDICLLVYDLCGQRYPKYQINEIFVAIFKAIRILLRQNFKVAIDKFGYFRGRELKEQEKYIPVSGKKAICPRKTKVSFRSSRYLDKELNTKEKNNGTESI